MSRPNLAPVSRGVLASLAWLVATGILLHIGGVNLERGQRHGHERPLETSVRRPCASGGNPVLAILLPAQVFEDLRAIVLDGQFRADLMLSA